MSGDSTTAPESTAASDDTTASKGMADSRATASTDTTPVARLDEWAAGLRANPTRRRATLIVGFVAGLALAWVHWLGLVAGGALVGLTRRSVPRAVLAGLGFGATTLVVTVLAPGTVGLGAVAALAPVSYAAAAIGLVLPAWGALVRGVV